MKSVTYLHTCEPMNINSYLLGIFFSMSSTMTSEPCSMLTDKQLIKLEFHFIIACFLDVKRSTSLLTELLFPFKKFLFRMNIDSEKYFRLRRLEQSGVKPINFRGL